MSTSQSDSVAQRPTLEQEIAKFKGFSTTDGEISDGAQTAEETAALAARAAQEKAAADAAAAAEEQETPEEKAAREAQEAADAAAIAAGETPEQKKAREDAAAARAAAKPKKKSAQERINEAVKKQRAAERREQAKDNLILSLNERVARLEGRAAAAPLTAQPAATTTQQSDSGEPDPKKFEFGDSDPAYLRALARYTASKTVADDKAADEAARQRQATQAAAAEFNERLQTLYDAGADKYDDYFDVVVEGARTESWALSPIMGEMILDSEHGVDISYQLASDPNESRRIAKLTPGQQAAWFGRREAELSAKTAAGKQQDDPSKKTEPVKQPVQTSKAPVPLQQQARGNSAKPAVDGATQDFAAFERLAMGERRTR